MGITLNRSSVLGRLSPLRFDDSRSFEEDTKEDDVEDDILTTDSKEHLVVEEEEIIHRRASNILRYGPLAISEIDEEMGFFDLSSPTKVVNLLRGSGTVVNLLTLRDPSIKTNTQDTVPREILAPKCCPSSRSRFV